ncbi:MAG TPA: hypothetical protein VMB80_07785 [Candidatus Acidoferrum sp.]|nr:hypothetical protein [Candidatus Acidoferrum sp.]
MNRKTKAYFVAGVVLLGILAVAFASLAWYPKHARRAWKEAALPEIRQLADDSNWVSREIHSLGATNSGQGHIIAERWLSDHMILMQDGEWLVYKSHCGKEAPHRVSDIFLAKGSNGKWYYSTCHFCVGMCVLVMLQDTPPIDLATFARVYHLKEFDGVSDACLLPTQTFPDNSQEPARIFTANIKPAPPDLSFIRRAAITAGLAATNSDPDLKGHSLTLNLIRYSHRFPQSDSPERTAYEAIYCDDTLSGGNATGIDIAVRDNVACFKSQKGQSLWSCTLDGQPKIPEEALKTIATKAITNFWPKIDGSRLSLDEIVCCDPLGGNNYSVNLRLASPLVEKSSITTYTLIEVGVGANGTVEESDVHWHFR